MLRDLENIVRDFLMPHWTTIDNNHVALMRDLLFKHHLYDLEHPHTRAYFTFARWLHWEVNSRKIGSWKNESEIDITY